MCNDIWYLGQNNWAVYTDDSTVAEQLHKLEGMELIAAYYHVKKRGILAVQFAFCDPDSAQPLLAKVCSIIGLDLKRVAAMKYNGEYIPYSRKYRQGEGQLQFGFSKKPISF